MSVRFNLHLVLVFSLRRKPREFIKQASLHHPLETRHSLQGALCRSCTMFPGNTIPFAHAWAVRGEKYHFLLTHRFIQILNQ